MNSIYLFPFVALFANTWAYLWTTTSVLCYGTTEIENRELNILAALSVCFSLTFSFYFFPLLNTTRAVYQPTVFIRLDLSLVKPWRQLSHWGVGGHWTNCSLSCPPHDSLQRERGSAPLFTKEHIFSCSTLQKFLTDRSQNTQKHISRQPHVTCCHIAVCCKTVTIYWLLSVKLIEFVRWDVHE